MALLSSISIVLASAVSLSAWRGERIAFRGALTNATGRSLTLGAPALAAPAGWRVRGGVIRDLVGYDVPRTGVTAIPDRVEWGGTRCMAPGDSGFYACEIEVPRTAEPGAYDLGSGVAVRVVGRTLPPPGEWSYHLDLWQHPWAVARTAGVEPFSEAHYRAMRPLWELLASAGQKVLTTTVVDLPWGYENCTDPYHSMVGRTKDAAGGWTFDYSVFDRYVEFGRSCGIGPDIACYTLCPWGKGLPRPGTPEFAAHWGPFLDDFAAHLRAKGWFANTCLAMDERPPDEMRALCAFVKAKDPAWRIALAGDVDAALVKDLDLDSYSQHLEKATPEFVRDVAAWRAKGRTVTVYTSSDRPPLPNCWAESDTDGVFWLGVAPQPLGLDGFLRWAYNSWTENPLADLRHSAWGQRWAGGATHFVYPDGSPAYRFLELVNGVQQAVKWRILAAERPDDPALAALARRYRLEEVRKGEPGYYRRLKADTTALLNRE